MGRSADSMRSPVSMAITNERRSDPKASRSSIRMDLGIRRWHESSRLEDEVLHLQVGGPRVGPGVAHRSHDLDLQRAVATGLLAAQDHHGIQRVDGQILS